MIPSTRQDADLDWHGRANRANPEYPYTVEEAHRVMRQYAEYRREDCTRKQWAWNVLVAAGRIIPDSGRQR